MLVGDILADVKMPHPRHEQHLCFLDNLGYVKTHLDEYKKLVKNARFVCKACGRVAVSDKNLCSPQKL